jgi:polyhydroxybutyrate depolymerase
VKAARALSTGVSLLLLSAIAIGCRARSGDATAGKTASAHSIDILSSVTVPGETVAATVTKPAPTPTATPAPVPDCTPARPHASGDENGTIESGGMQRTYILHVPPAYDGAHAMPLVVNLHGFGSNARQQAIYSGLPTKGDAAGFITVSPDGSGNPQMWTYPALAGATGVDDVGFIRDLLDKLERDLCIDEHRVFSAGISNGAAYSQVLACNLPGRFAAVAAVAALVYQPRCTDEPIAIIAFHGTADPCVPFEGGQVQCGQKLPIPSVKDAEANWAKHDSCDATPVTKQVSEHVSSVSYGGCKDGTSVVLYAIDGGGHTWPGAIVDVARLGATTHEISATDLIWQFFVQQGNLR